MTYYTPQECELKIDIAWDCPLGEFLGAVEQYQGSIINFMAKGPAGGNPFVTLLFTTPTMRDLFKNALLDDYAPLRVMSIVEADEPHETESQKDQPE